MESYDSGIAKTDEQVAQLLRERPPGWEYLLYAGALCAGVERLEKKYMDYSLGYAPRLGIVISPSEFFHFISSQLSELQVMINSLNTLVNAEVLADAVGPSAIRVIQIRYSTRQQELSGSMKICFSGLNGFAVWRYQMSVS